MTLVHYDVAAQGGPPVKAIDASRGVIGVRYGQPDNEIPLRVETTARGEEQVELVAAYLRPRLH